MSNPSPLNPAAQNAPFSRGPNSIARIAPQGFDMGSQDNSGEDETSPEATSNFYANLAEDISEEKLSSIAARLLDDIKQDLESRSEWENTMTLGMKYLGFKVEEFRDVPFMRACSAVDATLSTALLHFYSTARAELFPASGPARSEIIGSPTPEVEDQGERVKMFMNWYLTVKDKDYYSDSERLIMFVGLMGCGFRKVYQDPIVSRPLARFIPPQDFIINNHATSINSSDRMTEVVFLSRKDVLLRQASGDFIDFDLPKLSDDNDEEKSKVSKSISKMEGVQTDAHENKSLFKFYESHVNMDIDDVEPKKKRGKVKNKDRDIPRPYIVTVCCVTKKVVSIRRNWKESDDKYERIEHYVHYYYLPGFGIYSLGLSQIMGSNAITLTSITRQLVDAATLKNFPGGLRMRGMSIENNDKAVGPAEWLEVETGGMSLAECIMPMPYAEPSAVLLELRTQLKQDTATLVSTAETEIPEMGSNMPVGTTLALLEVANKLQSSILRSLHVSLGYELRLLFELFGEYLEEAPYPFAVPGKDTAIMKKDFNDKVSIVPVSDPNVLTSTHRLMRNEALLKLAQSNPEIHDMREAYHRMYQAMNVDNIDKLLPEKPKPMSIDPMAENMLMLAGKEITVKLFQDDDSHISVHHAFSQNPLVMGNPQVYATVLLHEQMHKSFKAFKTIFKQKKTQEIEQQIQQQMQPLIQQQMFMLESQGIPADAAKQMLQQQMQPQLEQMLQEQVAKIQLPEIPDEQVQQLIADPEVQNMVAKQDAEAQAAEAKAAAEKAEQQLNPDKVMVMEIGQRREASHLKDEADKLKAETEAFKAQLKFESETAKTESQREIASEKHEVDIALAEHKSVQPHVGAI